MKVGDALLLSAARGGALGRAPLLDRSILSKPARLEPTELLYLRLRAGWTGPEVARALGVSSNVTVSRWESGARHMPKPTERLFRLLMANALGAVSVEGLVSQFKSSWRHAGAPLEIHLYPKIDHFEYRWASPPKRFPKAIERLFWDTDARQLDLEQQADFIIARVLEKGDLEDWNWLRWTYGETSIAAVLSKSRNLPPGTVNLWKQVLPFHQEAR